MADDASRAAELRETLRYHDYRHHVLHEAEIAGIESDTLFRELQTL